MTTRLLDTSVWIEYFRATGSPSALEVRRVLSSDAGSVVMCEPIAMEILSGATQDVVYEKLERLINGLPSLALDESVDFRSAATIYRSARRRGMTIRSINDCVIAAVAIRHEAELIHRDADFDAIASFTPLTARRVR